jgi:hypothetical protein
LPPERPSSPHRPDAAADRLMEHIGLTHAHNKNRILADYFQI